MSIAQPTNSSCATAIEILDPIDYCSSFGEFNNFNAGPGNPAVGAATCWNNSSNDVWFRVTAFANALNITVSGNANGSMAGGSLVQPEVALYEDDGCVSFSELKCDSDDTNGGAANIFRGGLTIGQSYLIRVDSRAGVTGTFTLCIKNFNPPVEPGQDCITNALLCDKSPFIVQAISGGGSNTNEFDGIPCGFDEQGNPVGLTEQQTTWFSWTCDQAGSLSFILDPIIPGDDIDWALFELPNGLGDCTVKTHLRCAFNSPNNANGGTLDCGDLTGMQDSSNDTYEDFNCESNEDGFVQSINMTSGTSYLLGINNFTESGVGFEIEFGGSGTFRGPDADFMIDPLEGLRCDTFFTVTDLTTFDPNLGNIVSWEWNFGEMANPPTASGQGPWQVEYNGFGDKFITLTVETDQGCILTEVLPLFAEPCCDDLTDIEIDIVDLQNLVCATVPDGSVTVQGANGSPDYEYAIDGGTFNPNPFFGNLDAGSYQINIQDIKGCTDSIDVVITSPPPIVVDAGPDQTVELCRESQLVGLYSPMNATDSIVWNAQDTSDNFSLECQDCLDPIVVAPGETTYILTVVDEVGCSASDEVTIFVDAEYLIYGPNAFSPNGDGLHDRYTIYGGPAALMATEFYIYDRWGELIFFREDMPLNDDLVGWDGRFKNSDLSNQVMTWYAKVLFCDNEGPDDTQNFHGSFTIVR